MAIEKTTRKNKIFLAPIIGLAIPFALFPAIASVIHVTGKNGMFYPQIVIFATIGVLASMFMEAIKPTMVRGALNSAFAILPPFLAISLASFSWTWGTGDSQILDFLIKIPVFLLLITLPVCAVSSAIRQQAASSTKPALTIFLICFGGLLGSVSSYIAGYAGLPIMASSCFAGVLLAFSTFSGSNIKTCKEEKCEFTSGAKLFKVLSVVSGVVFGVTVLHAWHIFRVFQMPQALSGTSFAVIIFLFAMIGIFLGRTNLEAPHKFLNLILKIFKRKEFDEKLDTRSFFSYSLVATGVSLLWMGMITNALGRFLARIALALKQSSEGSLLVVVFLKTALLWGPFFACVICMFFSMKSLGRKALMLFLAGTALAGIFYPLTIANGVEKTVYGVAGLAIAAGIIGLLSIKMLFKAPFVVRIVAALALAALFLWQVDPSITLPEKIQLFSKSDMTILLTEETQGGTLTVANYDNENPDLCRTDLYLDSVYYVGITSENRFMHIAGILPKLFGKNPQKALVLNYGTGIPTASLISTGTTEFTAVDRSEMKFDLQQYFEQENALPLNNPGATTLAVDPISAVRKNLGKFDVVLFEQFPTNLDSHWEEYSASFLKNVNDKLNEGGLCILPISVASADMFKSIANNFSSVFAETHVFCFRGGTILVGANTANLTFDLTAANSLFTGNLAVLLRRQNLNTPYGILSGYIGKWNPEKTRSDWYCPIDAYKEEWVLLSGLRKQAEVITMLQERRIPLEGIKAMFKPEDGLNADMLERFYNSGNDVLKGMELYLNRQSEELVKEAAENFLSAFTNNQGDIEAKWFFNYLQERGVVGIEKPEKEDEFEKLMRTITTSSDTKERTYSLIKLNGYLNRINTTELASLMNDTEPEIRRLVTLLLGKFNDRLSIIAVERMLDDESIYVVKGAMSAAVMQNNSGAVPKLIEKLDDPELRLKAIHALNKLGTFESAKKFIELLPSSNDAESVLMLRALAKSGSPAMFPQILAKLEGSKESIQVECILALRSIADRYSDMTLVPEFRKLLTSDSLTIRFHAILGLGDTGGKEEYPALRDIYIVTPENEDEIMLNTFIIEAMAKCGQMEAFSFIQQLIQERNSNISSAAITAIGLIDSDESRKVLNKLATDESIRVKRAALRGLVKADPKEAFSTLTHFLSEPDVPVQAYAYKLLANLKTSESNAYLLDKLRQGSRRQRIDAANNARYTESTDYLEPLLDMFNTNDVDFFAPAANSIVALADEDFIVRFCIFALQHSSQDVRIAAQKALRRLPKELSKDYPITLLAETLLESKSRTELAEITRTLSALCDVENAPQIRKNTPDVELVQTIKWWKDRYISGGDE